MKKSLYLMTAAVLFALGCEKEARMTAPASSEGVLYTFEASLDADTRASIADDGQFSWSAGDEIALYNSVDGKFYTFTAEAADGNFSAIVPEGSRFTRAIYPATLAESENSILLPERYSLEEAASGKYFPMLAEVSGSQLVFSHLGTLLKLSIQNVPVNATELTLSATASVSGSFAFVEQDGKQQIAAGQGTSTLTVEIAHDTAEDLVLYLPVPVGTYSYSLSLGDGETVMLSKETRTAKELKRAQLLKMAALMVEYPSTSYQLRGWFSHDGVDYNWDGGYFDFEAIEGLWGWLKAAEVGLHSDSDHISVKLSDGSTWTGIEQEGHQIAGTMLNVANDGEGKDLHIYANAALDIYYNPVKKQIFALDSGLPFALALAGSEELDAYTLTGAVSDIDWGGNLYFSGIPGVSGWRVVHHVGLKDGQLNFKFWKNDWNSAFGAEESDVKAAGVLAQSGGNNIQITGDAASYDVYLSTDKKQFFALPSGSAFAVPQQHENQQLYVGIGRWKVNGTSDNWAEDFAFEMLPGSSKWMVLRAVSVHEEESTYLGFKLRKKGSWDTQVGFAEADPWKNVGACYATQVRRDNQGDEPKNCNVYVPDGSPIDIYVKTDLSQIGFFSSGTSPDLDF